MAECAHEEECDVTEFGDPIDVRVMMCVECGSRRDQHYEVPHICPDWTCNCDCG